MVFVVGESGRRKEFAACPCFSCPEIKEERGEGRGGVGSPGGGAEGEEGDQNSGRGRMEIVRKLPRRMRLM